MAPKIHIDPTLSVYQLVNRTKEQRTLLNHRRTMAIISKEIENAALLDNVRPRVFAGFQKMSFFLKQLKRYERLAMQAESIYVFGNMDVQPPAIQNITYVPLQLSDQLSREWFLIADAPDYFSALATEEQSKISDPDEKRVFQGVWSFDEEIVSILQEWLTSLVDARPLVDLKERRNYRKQASLMSKTLGRLTARLAKAVDNPAAQSPQVSQEVTQVIEQQLAPSLDQTKKIDT